jgi:hypothetical protein
VGFNNVKNLILAKKGWTSPSRLEIGFFIYYILYKWGWVGYQMGWMEMAGIWNSCDIIKTSYYKEKKGMEELL